MAQPETISEKYRDVVLTAELVKGTGKPTRCWVRNGATARYILEIYRTVAGGDAALRAQPMVEAFLEPISPLQLPGDGLDIVKEFAQAGQPVSIGPMAMTAGTAPGTLAATLAQENAEILAGIVITQLLAPGTPITYGGIPHIMDPRTRHLLVRLAGTGIDGGGHGADRPLVWFPGLHQRRSDRRETARRPGRHGEGRDAAAGRAGRRGHVRPLRHLRHRPRGQPPVAGLRR